DGARYPGRKVVVVFSNGPDNASVVPPEDVAELAQSVGIPVYMVSTTEARLEPVSTAVFERMSAATGGKAYFAKNWRDEKKAFASIRNDLGHLYSISYYPAPNLNHGWRTINVKLVGEHLKKYHVRTRSGYRLLPVYSREEIGEQARPKHLGFPVIYNFVKSKQDCRCCFWVGEAYSKTEPVQNPKPRHFKPFEFFDHSVLQKHTEKELIMNELTV